MRGGIRTASPLWRCDLRGARELINITSEVQALVAESGCSAGVCHIYVPHTTAGVIINEGV